jgi:16S rRNA (guanine1516-N2)-methyltransferase
MLERHPVIFALLQDGLNRGRLSDNEQVRSICSNLSPIKTNARDWLHELSAESKPDVIYMDPMFPQRSKSAKVKKAISGLQNLAGEDNDYLEVLTEAVKNAGKRVVVKRPAGKSDDWLKDILTPDFEITGKTIRFCVFLPRN